MPCSKDGRPDDCAWVDGSTPLEEGCLRLSLLTPSHAEEPPPSASGSLALRLSALIRRMRSRSSGAPIEISSLLRFRALRGGDSSRCRNAPSFPL